MILWAVPCPPFSVLWKFRLYLHPRWIFHLRELFWDKASCRISWIFMTLGFCHFPNANHSPRAWNFALTSHCWCLELSAVVWYGRSWKVEISSRMGLWGQPAQPFSLSMGRHCPGMLGETFPGVCIAVKGRMETRSQFFWLSLLSDTWRAAGESPGSQPARFICMLDAVNKWTSWDLGNPDDRGWR